jgi:formylglycine-generating enzyme required for sulfatase activity
LLASASGDRTVRLWQLDQPQAAPTILHGHDSWIGTVAFSPEGRFLASAGGDSNIFLWVARMERLADEVCQKVLRNLTHDEWLQFVGGDLPYEQTCGNIPIHPTLVKSAEEKAVAGDLDTAKVLFQRVRELTPSLNLEPVTRTNNLAAQGFITRGRALARQGNIEAAVDNYTDAQKLVSNSAIPAQDWNLLCQFGSLWGHAHNVIQACEQAVALDSDNGEIRNNRGLARALTENYEGALDDFRFFVQWGQGKGEPEQLSKRQAWIQTIQANHNPFDDITLKEVLDQVDNMGELVVQNTLGAQLTLKRIHIHWPLFQITEQSLENLRTATIPDDVLEKLLIFKDKRLRYKTFAHFLRITLGDDMLGVKVDDHHSVESLILASARYRDEETIMPFQGSSIQLEGPADYMLTAKQETWMVHYPIHITGYDHKVVVTVQPPPADVPSGMVYVPGGIFRMGNKEDGDAIGDRDEYPQHDRDEYPQHDVDVDGFFMDQYEVSREHYKAFIDAGGYLTRKYWTAAGWRSIPKPPYRTWSDFKENEKENETLSQPQMPVLGVTWYEADAYCRWQKRRLPTEAEWEKAAAGPQGYKWSFGNDFDKAKGERVVYGERTKNLENGYGLYGMSGSAWEWVEDRYDGKFYANPESSRKNPVNLELGEGEREERVVRGGAWRYKEKFLRVADRNRYPPSTRHNILGFRCASWLLK